MLSVKPISLDGSTLEGGGQLVRVAFSLSAITGVPVHVYNIRANRMAKGRTGGGGGGGGGRGSGSGSATQRKGKGEAEDGAGGGAKESHLAALLWLAGQCDAYVEGAEVGSREVLFVPGAGGSAGGKKKKTGSGSELVDLENGTINLERPGSTCLILQCILPYLLFAASPSPSPSSSTNTTTPVQDSSSPSDERGTSDTSGTENAAVTELTLYGGTNVSKAMTTDYVQHVFLPMLRRIVGPSLPEITLETVRRGWAGGASQVGEVTVRVARGDATRPFKIDELTAVDRGDIEKISVVIVADGETVRQAILDGLKAEIATILNPELPIDVIENQDSGDIRRVYVLLIAHTSNGYRLGRDHLGTGRRPKNTAEQRKIIEECVRSVVRDLNTELKRGGCVDEFMQDQIVMLQALGRGIGRVDGGEWRENGGKGVDVEVGDEGGSLHARTVRWVCERVLRGLGGVEFGEAGQCRGVGWNWDGKEGVDLDGERNGSSVGTDLERLKLDER